MSYHPNRTANSANPAAIFCQSAAKKPLCDLNFIHIFEILSSNRYEYQCQMLERIFVVFQGSRNLPWYKGQEISKDFFLSNLLPQKSGRTKKISTFPLLCLNIIKLRVSVGP